jgi:hypothetical protein
MRQSDYQQTRQDMDRIEGIGIITAISLLVVGAILGGIAAEGIRLWLQALWVPR